MIEHGSSDCTVDNSLAKARVLSSYMQTNHALCLTINLAPKIIVLQTARFIQYYLSDVIFFQFLKEIKMVFFPWKITLTDEEKNPLERYNAP